MQHRICTNIFILFLLTSALFSSENNNLLLRRHYTLDTENQEIIDTVNQIYSDIYTKLSNQYTLVHIDSAQKFINAPFLKSFTQDFSLRSMLNMQAHLNIGYFVYFELEHKKNTFDLVMTIVEFPSNVFVHSFRERITEKSDIHSLSTKFSENFKLSAPQPLGQPFSHNGIGMIYLASSQHPFYQDHITILDKWLKRAPQRFRLKVINTMQPELFKAQDLLRCRANFALLYNNEKSGTVWQNLDRQPTRLKEIDLPMWPNNTWQSLAIQADENFPDYYISAWFPDIQLLRSQQLYSEQTQQNAAAVSVAALFNLTPYIESANAARLRNIQLHYQQLFDHFIDEQDKLAWIALNSATLHQQHGESEIALTGYKSAELSFMGNNNSRMQLCAALQQAEILAAMQDYQSAINTLLTCHSLAKEINEKELTADIQDELGDFYQATAKPLNAWTAWEKAIEIYKATNQATQAVSVCLKAAQLLDQPEYGTHAEQFYIQGLALSEQLLDIDLQAQFKENLGNYYKTRMDEEQARAYFIQAVDDLERLGKTGKIATMDIELGDSFARTRMHRNAKTHYLYALQYYQSIASDSISLKLLLNIGDMQSNLQRWKRAEWNYQQALYYAEKSQNTNQLVLIYYKLGLVQIQDGNYDKGLKSIKLARLLNDGKPVQEFENSIMLNEIKDLLEEQE